MSEDLQQIEGEILEIVHKTPTELGIKIYFILIFKSILNEILHSRYTPIDFEDPVFEDPLKSSGLPTGGLI
jgi:hypothetical protein